MCSQTAQLAFSHWIIVPSSMNRRQIHLGMDRKQHWRKMQLVTSLLAPALQLSGMPHAAFHA